MDNSIRIRMATVADAPALLGIYAPYVEETAITFEVDVPTRKDFAARVERTLERYPYIVAESDNELWGYAYASAFRPRAGYVHTAETSIYVRTDCKGNGVGRRLYTTLEKLCALQGIYLFEACIAHIEPADAQAPATSRLFHERLGYRLVGRFNRCGRKFGRWFDMIYMEKEIAPRNEGGAQGDARGEHDTQDESEGSVQGEERCKGGVQGEARCKGGVQGKSETRSGVRNETRSGVRGESPHGEDLKPFIPFPEVDGAKVREILENA